MTSDIYKRKVNCAARGRRYCDILNEIIKRLEVRRAEFADEIGSSSIEDLLIELYSRRLSGIRFTNDPLGPFPSPSSWY